MSATSLTSWSAAQADRPRIRGPHRRLPTVGRMRFAFYGRTSTDRFQDPVSSRQWQRDSAVRTIAERGRIVTEFVDVGCSRSVSWHDRPQAAALLQAATDPDRGFDAVVIGEFERAFDQGQARAVIARLNAYGVAVWLPEFDGPVDLRDADHRALFALLGHQSEREVLRARWRTTVAMRAQVRVQGRHLGGRPPYGYRLVDAGPHPNKQHARWGRRLRRLDPDPVTAPQVQRIFAQRLAGTSVAGIARSLNAAGIPPPSAHDPDRNRHRTGTEWTLRTAAAILANPRYTGRQVWNRQHTDHHEVRPGDKSSRPAGSHPTRAWNPRTEWEFSAAGTHPALVSEADFLAAQQISAVAEPDDANLDRYRLTGLVICGLCGRRSEGHWAHGRARYRCRHGSTSASDARPERARTLYVRQDLLIEQARLQLADLLNADPADLDEPEMVTQLRARDIRIVCTPVSITLDTGTAEQADPDGDENPSLTDDDDHGRQLTIPGLLIPQPPLTRRSPRSRLSANVKDRGGG
jgi:site-specific DNA recombinase